MIKVISKQIRHTFQRTMWSVEMVYGIVKFHVFLALGSGRRTKSPSLSPNRDLTPEFAIGNAKEKRGSERRKEKGN